MLPLECLGQQAKWRGLGAATLPFFGQPLNSVLKNADLAN
jgi:hypothetical protein